MELLKSLKNELFKIIVEQDLSPVNFTWSTAIGRFNSHTSFPILKYNLNFSFMFEDILTITNCYFTPGNSKYEELAVATNWNEVKTNFIKWLGYIRREIDQPDLWGNASKYALKFGTKISIPESNQQFTIPQFDELKDRLNKIHGFLEEQGFHSAVDRAFIIEKVKYLEDAAKRQGAKDWFHTFMGGILSIAIGLSMDPEKAKALFEFSKNIVKGIVLIGN